MTDAERPFEVGDRVLLREGGEFYRLNTSNRYTLREGQPFEVTRVVIGGLHVRTIGTIHNRWSGREERMTFAISFDRLDSADPNAPRPRKLGEMPDPEKVNLPDGVPLIGIDHPGIQWLFDDMGAYADKQGYCSQYDALCVKLGIPGRPRDFSVKKTIGGIEVTATIKARSQREANEAFQAALAATPTLATVA